MNKFLLTLLLLTAAWSASAQDAKSLYMKYCNTKGVESSYISKDMFELFGRLPEIEIMDRDVDLAPLIRELKGVYMLESESYLVSSRIKEDFNALVKQTKCSLIMRDRDDDEETEIYAIFEGDKVTSLLFFAVEDQHEVAFICIEAEILKEDLTRTLNYAKQKQYKKLK